MTLGMSHVQRRYPLEGKFHPKPVAIAETNRITDLSRRPRMGLRGRTTSEWCAMNGLPFPEAINGVAATAGLRIARLGQYELLVIGSSDEPLPADLSRLPLGTYSGYRDETWAWLRIEGPDTYSALSTMTSVDIKRPASTFGRVVQTRCAGLDAVLVVGGSAVAPVIEIFVDLASSAYLVDVFADCCPEFAFLRGA